MSELRVEFTKYFNKPKFAPASLHSLFFTLLFLSLPWLRLYLPALWVDLSKAYKILLCPATSFQFPAGQAHSDTHTHTHTYTLLCVHIYCMFTGKFKKCNTPKLGFAPFLSFPLSFFSLSVSFPLTLVCCHRLTATAMAFLCKTTVCCQQHNGTRNTLSQCWREGRKAGGQGRISLASVDN